VRIPQIIAVAWLSLICGAVPAHAEKRVALVIGNGAYSHAEVLENPVNDARGVRDALKQIGFDVTYGENLDQRAMRQTLGQFARTIRGANVALVYYAGHGATFNDTPYVVPVDAEFKSLEQVPYELVAVETLIGELRRVNGLRIAVLDACRDNAAERELKRLAGGRGGETTRGLAPVKNPEGLILAYATQSLSTAADNIGADAHSPFTSALLHNITTPGLEVKGLFYRVGQEVLIATDGRQRPEISISVFEDYALVPAPTLAPAPASAPAVAPAPAPEPVFVPAAAPATTPGEETPQRTAVPPPVVTPPPGGAPEKPATSQQAAIPAPVQPEGPSAEPEKPRERHRMPTAARPSEREHHERRRPRWESAEREPAGRPHRERAEPQNHPLVQDCVHVAFPQCSRR
jgi:hypothetical protein